MHPEIQITVDGTPVTGAFWSRLVSVSITDQEGERSDSIQLELNDSDPFIEIPRKGAIIRVHMGYRHSGTVFMGAYTADDIDVKCLPYSMSISGKSADMRAGLKEKKERHWDNKKIGDVVKQIASENGLEARVSDKLANIEFPWLGQLQVSDIHFLKQLAKRNNALFSVKDGKAIFVEKGAGESASGQPLEKLEITPDKLLEGSCSVKFKDRSKYKKVKASYQDKEKAKRETVEVDADSKGEPTFKLRHTYRDKDEAEKAAQAKAKELQRSADTTSVTLEGNPLIRAGMPFVYKGVRPGVDGVEFIIETATHSFSKGAGYQTQVSGKVKV